MADPNINKTPEEMKKNETMQREQAKSELDKKRQSEKGGLDKERQEKSAIGGGKTQSGVDKQSPTASEFEKSRSEPTKQR